jgi:hypothetical protein
MLEDLSNEQIEARMTVLEGMIASCDDPKSLPALNATFQRLLDEQVRRDLSGRNPGDEGTG